MARIPEDELQRLKSETNLSALVAAAGVELRAHGADLVGRCPWHEDNGPSLVVTPAKNLWHCMGACQEGGTVIQWVMKARGVGFRHAVEILREGNAAFLSVPVANKVSTVTHLPAPITLDADEQKLLGQVVDFYHKTLKESPEALAYIESRGLRDAGAIDTFRLGYANRTLCYRLPAKNRKVGQVMRERLARTGIYRGSGHEHFAGSLVIPIFDERGGVVGIYGRKISDDLRPGTPNHLYLPGPHRGVWNLAAVAAGGEVILCESLIDALTFWCAGFRNVTAAYGVSGFTDEHLETFKRGGVQKVLIAYDRDDAGESAAEKLAPRLAEAGIDAFRIRFPRNMDANEFALKMTPPKESLGVLIRSAAFMLKGSGRAENAPASADLSPEAHAAKGEATADRPAPEPEPEVSSLAAEKSPPAPADGLAVHADRIEWTADDRTYRVRGFEKNLSFEQMRINLRVSREEKYHVDTLEFYSARQREMFVKAAAAELGVRAEAIKKDIGRLLWEMEKLQEKRIHETLKPKEQHVVIPEAEKAEAFALLRDPNLLARITDDLTRVGIIGEEVNKLVGYLALVSRKMEEPLAILIQSNSAAGKSALMDALLSLVPEEDVRRYTAMTGQSLFYMGQMKLAHKVLAIAEVEGAQKAGYPIKMLQSEGRITIVTTVKDPTTGKLEAKENEVEGPVAIVLTTTEAEVDPELQNRAIVLTVDEGRRQTREIHRRQRRAQTLDGMLERRDREAVTRLHQNAQRLLRPLMVVNPFADRLTFLDTKLRTRRDHVKYLTLIRAIALLHQYQRPMKQAERGGRVVPYIEVTVGDIERANELAAHVLGRSLDELAPQARRLLALLEKFVGGREDFRFSRRDVREYAAWSDFQVRKHLDRLVELEYVLVHRGGRGQSFVYELLYDGGGKSGEPFLVGLIDARHLYDSKFEPPDGEFEPSLSPHRAPIERGSSPHENGSSGAVEAEDERIAESAAETRI